MQKKVAVSILFMVTAFLLLGCGTSGGPSGADNLKAGLLVLEAKEKIKPDFPELIFRAYGDKKPSEYVKNGYDYTVNRIVIYKSGGKEEKIQELVFADIELMDAKPAIIFKDVNFDGYQDILLRKFTVDTAYKCWLWDEKHFRFIPNNGFETILNPSFDPDKKLIISLPEFDFRRTQYTKEYKFVENIPKLIRETKSFVSKDEKVVHITVSELFNGQMQVIREYDEPNEIVLLFTDKLHPSLPTITLKVYGKRKLSGGEDHIHFSAHKIAAYQRDGPELIQEIVFDDTWTSNSKSLGFIIEDMNFDGYKDIRIQRNTPAGPNISYYCWLWDNDANQFVKNKSLEGIIAPRFNHDKKIITSFVRESAAHHYDFTYKYIDGILTVIRIQERKGEIVDGKKIGHFITKELKDGKMQVIEEYTKPYD